MRFVVLALLVAAAAATSFQEWKNLHGKTYHPREEALRQAIWEKNLAFINEFNALGNHSYTLGMNQYGDLTAEEFRKGLLGVRSDMTTVSRGKNVYTPSNGAIPDSVDWRTQGYVTPIKDQGQCGSCWAFSTTGSLEGQHFKKTGQLVSLSEQNLVDCSSAQGNQGCNGGLMDSAFKYIEIAGIDTESSYPYTARDGTCKFSTASVGATCTGFTDVQKGNEDDLTNSIANVGPVSVAIDASHSSFQFYKSGVYDPTLCSSSQLDHGVLAVGYGTLSGKDYYIVKNSWGVSWGEKGYILMARNAKNKCGIATAASFPLV